jgi:hypothetical protein
LLPSGLTPSGKLITGQLSPPLIKNKLRSLEAIAVKVIPDDVALETVTETGLWNVCVVAIWVVAVSLLEMMAMLAPAI